ncbi:MAG: sprT domain-containing protein, partial [Bacteroidota bacterium]
LMTIEEIKNALSKYVPDAALDQCVDWIAEHKFFLRVTKSRNSKYGDYRPPKNGKGHIITVNHDMNPYAFLITYTHEVAHLVTFLKTNSLKDPHGKEWKNEFKQLMTPFLTTAVFPEDLIHEVKKYIHNPAATSCSDVNMLRALKKHDKHNGEWLHLEDLDMNTKFRTKTGRIFIKGKLIRKNFLCTEAKTKGKYTLNPLIEVQPMEV